MPDQEPNEHETEGPDRAGAVAALSSLTPDPRNARAHSDRNLAQIEAALREVGAARSIVVDETGVILAGNATVQAARHAGLTRVRVVEADGTELVAVRRSGLTAEQKRRLALHDNRAAELAEWDTDVLASLADELDLSDLWDPDELADLLAQEAPPPQLLADPDAVPEPPDDPITQLGDCWLLGQHRLLCGDATKAQDVQRLMAGEIVACLWTDPPYGVNYQGGTPDALTIANDHPQGLEGLLGASFANAAEVLAPGAPFYVAHPAGPLSLVFGRVVMELGWRLRQTLVWVKDSLVLGHADYHYRHEPILYGYLPGGAGRRGRGGKGWFGDDAQASVFEIPRPKASPDHPTSKPVALITAMLANSTQPGDLVLDLFGGSGSTLVACEHFGRRARLLELDPKYCDVVVRRWEELTGKPAERIPSDGAEDAA
ncbi:MAG: site-specific DNA-methyltransferase [Chloroflexota bacterium]|nr:site-specific DNA-methyltransferase [Chloroflexota bacterium]